MLKKYIITEEIMVKDYLKRELPERLVVAINQRGILHVNNLEVKNYYLMKPEDILVVFLPGTECSITPNRGKLKIVYQDSYLMVIEKEVMSVTPTANHPDKTLANYLMGYFQEHGIKCGVHLVSRLDRLTTGLIMVALNPYIQYQMQLNPPIKHYLLEVVGVINEDGEIVSGIERVDKSIRRQMIDGDTTKTVYQVIEKKDETTLLRAHLVTGKTHQLRVHFSSIGHPIVGDSLYSDGDSDLKLHSHYLEFVHPVSGETIKLRSYPSWFSLKTSV